MDEAEIKDWNDALERIGNSLDAAACVLADIRVDVDAVLANRDAVTQGPAMSTTEPRRHHVTYLTNTELTVVEPGQVVKTCHPADQWHTGDIIVHPDGTETIFECLDKP